MVSAGIMEERNWEQDLLVHLAMEASDLLIRNVKLYLHWVLIWYGLFQFL